MATSEMKGNSSMTGKKHDWGMFVVGVLLVIAAFVIMLWPGMTLVTLALIAGVTLLFAGGADLSAFFASKGVPGRGWIMVNAIVDIILGAMFIIHPIAAANVLPWLAGGFVIAYGVVAIVTSIGVRSFGSAWLLMLLNGILSITIGIMFFVNEAYFVIFLGVFLAMRGVLMCFYGIVSPRSLNR